MEKALREQQSGSAQPVVPALPEPARTTMNGKPVLWRDAKTVLSANEAFQEKLLCDGLTMNSGDLCTFSCSFCYVESQIWKLVHGQVREFNRQTGQSLGGSEVVVRRKEAVEVLKRQIRAKDDRPDDRRVVYGSTLVDVAGNLELLRETAELVTWILDKTHWQVRLLSKSHLLHRLVKDGLVPDRKKEGAAERHHQRIIFGFSTGTFDDRLAAAFESGTARVSKRLEALHWLQDEGFRTFGMICPSLPQEDYEAFSREAVHRLRPERMEHVWAEVINVRGESFDRTREALEQGGFPGQADRLAEVSLGTQAKVAWEQYARATFEAHRKHLPVGKLRFLQYVNKTNVDWWQAQRSQGAVLLGATARENGVCSTARSAPDKFYPTNP